MLARRGEAAARPVDAVEGDDVVGGDVYTGPSFVINAIAAGHEAAVSLHRFVQAGSSLTIGRNQRHYVELDKSEIALNPDSYDHAGRQIPACGHRSSYDEYSQPFRTQEPVGLHDRTNRD